MAQSYPACQWRVWFSEVEQSDLTVVKFCDLIGVSAQSYYQWRRKLKSIKSQSDSMVSTTAFVPLVLPELHLEIEFPGGVIARVPNDPNSLRPIVTVLLEQGAKQ